MNKRLKVFFLNTINYLLFNKDLYKIEDKYAVEDVKFSILKEGNQIDPIKSAINNINLSKNSISNDLITQKFSVSIPLKMGTELEETNGVSLEKLLSIAAKFGTKLIFVSGSGYEIVEDDCLIDSVEYITIKIDFKGNNVKLNQEYQNWINAKPVKNIG